MLQPLDRFKNCLANHANSGWWGGVGDVGWGSTSYAMWCMARRINTFPLPPYARG